jgi:hypothetical protein
MRIAVVAALVFFLLCSVTSAQAPETRTEHQPKEGGVVRCMEGPAVPSTRVEGIGTAISCSWAR